MYRERERKIEHLLRIIFSGSVDLRVIISITEFRKLDPKTVVFVPHTDEIK